MMFSVTLMCFEYMDVSLRTRVHPNQWDTELCDSAFTGSNDNLCIHTSALELSVNANLCNPCPSCRMVI